MEEEKEKEGKNNHSYKAADTERMTRPLPSYHAIGKAALSVLEDSKEKITAENGHQEIFHNTHYETKEPDKTTNPPNSNSFLESTERSNFLISWKNISMSLSSLYDSSNAIYLALDWDRYPDSRMIMNRIYDYSSNIDKALDDIARMLLELECMDIEIGPMERVSDE